MRNTATSHKASLDQTNQTDVIWLLAPRDKANNTNPIIPISRVNAEAIWNRQLVTPFPIAHRELCLICVIRHDLQPQGIFVSRLKLGDDRFVTGDSITTACADSANIASDQTHRFLSRYYFHLASLPLDYQKQLAVMLDEPADTFEAKNLGVGGILAIASLGQLSYEAALQFLLSS